MHKLRKIQLFTQNSFEILLKIQYPSKFSSQNRKDDLG